MDYVAIDFEANCLPKHGRSYPIEVGIADGRSVRSWLIRPQSEWRAWKWTDEALALHGIRPERLDREGLPAEQIHAELLTAIGYRGLVADSSLDNYWWRMLTTAAGADPESPTPIQHVATLLDQCGADSEEIMTAQRRADSLCPIRHRAGEDARWLWTLLDQLAHPVIADATARADLYARSSPWRSSIAA